MRSSVRPCVRVRVHSRVRARPRAHARAHIDAFAHACVVVASVRAHQVCAYSCARVLVCACARTRACGDALRVVVCAHMCARVQAHVRAQPSGLVGSLFIYKNNIQEH
jgi:hypothetical protein